MEEQIRVLLSDNALLQAALTDVRASLAHEHRPSSSTGALPARPFLALPMPLLTGIVLLSWSPISACS